MIVIAEDEPDPCGALVVYAERTGHAVESVDNGLAALEIVRKQHPSLLILDNHMPGMDGLDVLRTLRDSVECRSTPIIMFSGSSAEEQAEASAARVDAFVPKPDIELLLYEMDRLLHR